MLPILTAGQTVVDPADVTSPNPHESFKCFMSLARKKSHIWNITGRLKWSVLVFTAVNAGQSDDVSLTG